MIAIRRKVPVLDILRPPQNGPDGLLSILKSVPYMLHLDDGSVGYNGWGPTLLADDKVQVSSAPSIKPDWNHLCKSIIANNHIVTLLF